MSGFLCKYQYMVKTGTNMDPDLIPTSTADFCDLQYCNYVNVTWSSVLHL